MKDIGELTLKMQRKLQRYDKIIEKTPQSSFAYQQRMEANLFLGRGEAALKDLETALELSPNDEDLLNHPLNPQNESPQAPNDIKHAILFFNLANVLFELKNFEAALRYIDLALDRKSDFSNFHTLKGFILINLASAKKDKVYHQPAAQSLNQALQINPEDALAYYGRGVLEASAHTLEFNFTMDEEGALKTVSFKEINDPALERALADIKYTLKHLDNRPEIVRTAQFFRMQLYLLMGDVENALIMLNLLEKEGVENFYIYFLRTLVHFNLGNIEQSNADFMKYLELLPESDLKIQIEQELVGKSQATDSFIQLSPDLLRNIEKDHRPPQGLGDLSDFNLN